MRRLRVSATTLHVLIKKKTNIISMNLFHIYRVNSHITCIHLRIHYTTFLGKIKIYNIQSFSFWFQTFYHIVTII